MSLNHVAISGNITQDSEFRAFQNGNGVLNFSVAVNECRKNSQTGEWEDQASFVDCSLFGRRAQSLSQYLKRGTKVAIQGKLRQDRWQDNEGRNRSKLLVIVDELDFMSSRQNQAPQAPRPQQTFYHNQAPQAPMPAPSPAPQAPQYQQAPQVDVYDEDLPF